MRVRVVHEGGVEIRELEHVSDGATVADLVAALVDPGVTNTVSPGVVQIDGRIAVPELPLAEVGLVDGSTIVLSGGGLFTPVAANGSRTDVAVFGGPDAGHHLAVPSDGLVVGRGPDATLRIDNPTVSYNHATVSTDPAGQVAIEDHGALNGTWLGDASLHGCNSIEPGNTLRMGSSRLVVGRWAPSDRAALAPRPDRSGHHAINRPPRRAPLAAPSPIELPSEAEDPDAPRLAVAAIIAPLVIAAILVLALGSWRFAIFALLSPVMLLANHLSARRRHGRDRARSSGDFALELERVRTEVAMAILVERRRREGWAPDLSEIRRRVLLPSTRLWERRPSHADAMTVRLGFGSLRWSPKVASTAGTSAQSAAAAQELLRAAADLDDVVLTADLRLGPLAFVGDGIVARRAARSVVLQLCSHHGPADLRVAVLTEDSVRCGWDWATWLPHARPFGTFSVVTGDEASDLASRLESELEEHESLDLLLVVDSPSVLQHSSGCVRRLLERTDRRVFGLVITERAEQLPASVRRIVEITDGAGSFSSRDPREEGRPETGVIDGVRAVVAEDIARSMARLADPERAGGTTLPDAVSADAFTAFADLDRSSIRARWSVSHIDALPATVGLGSAGPVEIDLVADGPHALVGGTTGSGKSEFLRTLIASLSIRHPPENLVFVLIDYKGGSAFDRCASLPHVVAVVTDLDDHLAERALQSLEAELRHREERLRIADVDRIGALTQAERIPRLVVVVDEFASLRSELPEFVDALVDIARRGRSLGVHLVLATQRPSGVVDANIRANTNLRVALRVQDDADSRDVVDDPSAAGIPADSPGRAVLRIGSAPLLDIQMAHVSGTPASDLPPVVAAGWIRRTRAESDATLLDLVAGRLVEAFGVRTRPRRPWLDPLPDDLSGFDCDSLESLDDAPTVLVVADDPGRQRWVTAGWDPARGSLLGLGALGSGVSTLLERCAGELCGSAWVYVVDHAGGGLAGLSENVTTAYLLPGESERHRRLLSFLEQELDRRSGPDVERTQIVVVVDGWAGFSDEIDGTGAARDRLERVVRDGPAVGISFAIGASRPGDVPSWMRSGVRRMFVFELANPDDYAVAGVRRRVLPTFVPGRLMIDRGGLVGHVVRATPSRRQRPLADAPRIDVLPEVIDLREFDAVVPVRVEDGLYVPFAIDERTRCERALELRPGEHALVAGPSGSGRTTALLSIARQLRKASSSIALVGAGIEGDAFDAVGELHALTSVIDHAATAGRRVVVFVDDAERTPADDPLMSRLVHLPLGLTVIASARPGALRTMPSHWVRHVRSSAVGLLLQPDVAIDGDLLMVRIPRDVVVRPTPGRGVLVASGETTVVQVAIST
ncbi:MAG: FtsK/SpoIIIE domain-containing protein [Acidimicrobiales bacterium]